VLSINIHLAGTILEQTTKLYYSLVEAQIASGVSQHTWRAWVQGGKVNYARAGAKILIPASEIERILRVERKKSPTSDAQGQTKRIRFEHKP